MDPDKIPLIVAAYVGIGDCLDNGPCTRREAAAKHVRGHVFYLIERQGYSTFDNLAF